MHLLHTVQDNIEDISETRIEEEGISYAILSHRWGTDEVSYHQWIGKKPQDQLYGPGYTKILEARRLAASQGYQWIWIDTCCIDKRSSAELSEDLNSMYKYYSNAKVCYALLADVDSDEDDPEKQAKISTSQWFTRGWTLQELLAPARVEFYNSTWTYIGRKEDSDFADMLSRITTVPKYYLQNPKKIHSASVAARMSWASKRRTERKEDRAYSLMGLFMVHMPVLYGEGNDAFFRLQLEIIKRSDDESIFAWESEDGKPSGMFALSPEAFANSGDIIAIPLTIEHRLPWAWTNKGLELRLATKRRITAADAHTMRFGEPFKKVTLGCWKSMDTTDVNTRKPTPEESRYKIVSIEIERAGSTWKRVRTDCLSYAEKFETYRSKSRMESFSPAAHENREINTQHLYYVAQ